MWLYKDALKLTYTYCEEEQKRFDDMDISDMKKQEFKRRTELEIVMFQRWLEEKIRDINKIKV